MRARRENDPSLVYFYEEVKKRKISDEDVEKRRRTFELRNITTIDIKNMETNLEVQTKIV